MSMRLPTRGKHDDGGGKHTEAIVHAGAPLPEGARIVLISTRRAQPAADALAGSILAKYILHDMLASVTAPFHELSTAHLVVLEVPPVVTAGFERDLLNFAEAAGAEAEGAGCCTA